MSRSTESAAHDPLLIGVSGFGSIGSRHARLLSGMDEVQLAVCDVNAESLRAAQRLPAVQRVTDSYSELLAWDLDGIVIATPEGLHVEQGIAAAQCGRPLLVEKPLAETAADARRLHQCVEKYGVPAMTGYVLRYTSVMRLARDLLDQKLIGRPVAFHIMLGAYDTLLSSRMRHTEAIPDRLFLDYSHEWDLISWLLGPVKRVVVASHQSGDLERTQNPNVADCLCELQSGATGTVHLDYVQLPGRRDVMVIGDAGTMRIDAPAGRLELIPRNAEFHRSYHRSELRDDAFVRQLLHFLAVIRGDVAPQVTIEDGLRAAQVADAVIASNRHGTWQQVKTID